MEREFDHWNANKKFINAHKAQQFCHLREIWWCALGVNIGDEQNGTGKRFDRPVVVVKKFNERIFFCAMLTGKRREEQYYFPVGKVDDREASVILSQVRLIDTKRLIKKITVLDKKLFEDLKSALRRTLFE